MLFTISVSVETYLCMYMVLFERVLLIQNLNGSTTLQACLEFYFHKCSLEFLAGGFKKHAVYETLSTQQSRIFFYCICA